MTITRRTRAALLPLLFASAALPSPVAARTLPDRFELGRDANGQPCVATRGWSVGKDGINFQSDQGFSITCRGVAAARVQGYVALPAPDAAPADEAACGAAGSGTLAGIGAVDARRCFDARLQAPAVTLRLTRPEGRYDGAAVETALAPLETLLRIVAIGGDTPGSDARTTATIDVAALAPAPVAAGPAGASGASDFTAQSAIAQGLTLIHGGRRVEASRLLNDAVSEFADAPALVRSELRLTAGLADSNISQFEAAKGHFAAAEALLVTAPESDARTTLATKRDVYRALDATNQKQWATALGLLDARATDTFPLTDPVTLSRINQNADRRDASAAVNLANVAQLDRLVLQAEADWVRSLSHLGLGQIDQSRSALNKAAESVRALQANNVQTNSIAWLRAGLERQRGRIEDTAGNLDTALAGYDCAILTMQNAPIPGSLGCLFQNPAQQRSGALAASPTVIAEAQLDRAKVRARQPGVDQVALLADYDGAIETLTTGGGANGTAPLALAGYLDTLIAAAAQAPSPAIDDQYFKALQVAGEPAVAREIVRLQSVVAADNSVQALLADRTDLEREVVRLRYEIQATSDSAALADLTQRQTAARNALDAINAKIAPTLNSVDERPATIADVRAQLRAGEVYFKLATLNGRIYAAVVGADTTMIYRVERSAARINTLAGQVLRSGRSFIGQNGRLSLRSFAVDASFDLFSQIAGPARAMLTAARSISYDPVGELRNLPAAILVAQADPNGAQRGRTDYSQVAFLGRNAELTTALSPRSFVVLRSKAAGGAPRPFLGLGETNYAPSVNDTAGATVLQLAPGCRVSYARWAAAYNGNIPISAREISLSAAALGVGQAPMITGAAFSDANLERASAAGELAQYQVLHFATHGLTAQPFDAPGCETGLPPSLLTTLATPDAQGPNPSNGLLSFDEVAGLRLNANLVFLSACETAAGVSETAGRLTGQEDSTPSLDGLVRAFLAHTRTVVATMWSVPATPATDELIETFYRSGRSASIAGALRTAQAALITRPETSHPYFWGAYFVVGDGSKPMLTTPTAVATAPSPGIAPKPGA